MTTKTTNIDWITPGAQAIISDYHPDTDRHTAAPVSVLSVTGSRVNYSALKDRACSSDL